MANDVMKSISDALKNARVWIDYTIKALKKVLSIFDRIESLDD